ncbi:unnamed protein product [Schistosoma intercalatum]|nr:unnamed protein product [Schistosoma intercalatum]
MIIFQECYQLKNNRLHRSYRNGSGIPSDGYVLFVDAINTITCYGGAAAYASSCLMDEETDRPILGFINVCPGNIGVHYPEDRISIGVFLHEIGHALNAARKHFNCEQLDGADLENQYQTGPIGSHWEGRTYAFVLIISPSGVFCTNFHYYYSFVNDVEFDFINSFMSFSSWYTVDYSKAMKWEYGRQLGCDFSMKSCFDYAQIRRQQKFIPFCDTVNEARCRDAFSYGRCIIVRYGTPVPKEDRFFLKAPFDTEYPPEYFGGNDPFTDYCPTMAYKCFNDGTLGLFFKDSTVNCTRKDEPVRFNVSDGESRLNGKILCPNVNRFCRLLRYRVETVFSILILEKRPSR